MGATVICISGSDGSRVEELAAAVGAALGFHVINEEITERAAAAAGVDRQTVEGVEQRKSARAKILDLLASSGGAHPGFLIADPQSAEANQPSDELRRLIRSAIEEFVAAGSVVILAHAASQVLAGRDHVLRVLVVASPQARSARLADSLGIPAKKADARVKNGDAGRADYLKRFYGVERELPTQYDVVINTDQLTPEEGAAAVVSLASAVFTHQTGPRV
jgi:cytidylate kinase